MRSWVQLQPPATSDAAAAADPDSRQPQEQQQGARPPTAPLAAALAQAAMEAEAAALDDDAAPTPAVDAAAAPETVPLAQAIEPTEEGGGVAGGRSATPSERSVSFAGDHLAFTIRHYGKASCLHRIMTHIAAAHVSCRSCSMHTQGLLQLLQSLPSGRR